MRFLGNFVVERVPSKTMCCQLQKRVSFSDQEITPHEVMCPVYISFRFVQEKSLIIIWTYTWMPL
jgi:hypothetical protein